MFIKSKKNSVVLYFILITNITFGQIPNLNKVSYSWKTDTSKHTYEYGELKIVTEKNVIPTLNYPEFIKKEDKRNNYYNHEPAIVVNLGGHARAYPLSILTLFELSNDSIDGKQIMVSYCPMCNAALVFNRKVKTPSGDNLLHFGISGLLIHNDMVMYDYETETWWGQLTGEGIAGNYSGVSLKMLPALLISVGDFFDRFPQGRILSPSVIDGIIRKEGHRQFYHLEHQETLSEKYFLPEKIDKRLPPLEHVLGIHYQDHDRIYPFHELSKQCVVHEKIGNSNIVIFYHGATVTVLDEDNFSKAKKIGSAAPYMANVGGIEHTFKKAGNYFKDDQTASLWDITGYCKEGKMKGTQLEIIPHTNHFAFAYLSFFPEAEIYREAKGK